MMRGDDGTDGEKPSEGSAALRAWQTRLASLVVDDSGPRRRATCDDDWWGRVDGSPGMRVTRRIRRSWCLSRAAFAAPLTLPLVPDAAVILDAWVRRGGGAASFPSREAVALLDFIRSRLDPRTHAFSVCSFERAIHVASAADPPRGTHPAPVGGSDVGIWALEGRASVVEFFAEPAQVLLCASQRAQMPPFEEKRHWMLVAPTLPDLHRAATEAEARFLLDGLRSPRAAADGEAARMHSRLRTEGIVVTRVPPSE
jgi:hypothetical protein